MSMDQHDERYGSFSSRAELSRAESFQYQVLDAHDLATAWRRCSLSSDFWAKYASLFAPSVRQQGELGRSDLENACSYLLNELFENCAKFSRGHEQPVEYRAWIFPDHLVFQLSNRISPGEHEGFTSLIRELLGQDPGELYFRRLEENAETGAKTSGLGYLTLMKDYGVNFGFGFKKMAAHSIQVDVQARISRKEL